MHLSSAPIKTKYSIHLRKERTCVREHAMRAIAHSDDQSQFIYPSHPGRILSSSISRQQLVIKKPIYESHQARPSLLTRKVRCTIFNNHSGNRGCPRETFAIATSPWTPDNEKEADHNGPSVLRTYTGSPHRDLVRRCCHPFMGICSWPVAGEDKYEELAFDSVQP